VGVAKDGGSTRGETTGQEDEDGSSAVEGMPTDMAAWVLTAEEERRQWLKMGLRLGYRIRVRV